MKKIKLIAPILGAAATLGTAVPLASCGPEQYDIQITEEANITVTPTKFELNKDLVIHYEVTGEYEIDVANSTIQVGEETTYKGDDLDYDFDASTVTLTADKVTSKDITVDFKATNKVYDLQIVEEDNITVTPTSFEIGAPLVITYAADQNFKLNKYKSTIVVGDTTYIVNDLECTDTTVTLPADKVTNKTITADFFAASTQPFNVAISGTGIEGTVTITSPQSVEAKEGELFETVIAWTHKDTKLEDRPDSYLYNCIIKDGSGEPITGFDVVSTGNAGETKVTVPAAKVVTGMTIEIVAKYFSRGSVLVPLTTFASKAEGIVKGYTDEWIFSELISVNGMYAELPTLSASDNTIEFKLNLANFAKAMKEVKPTYDITKERGFYVYITHADGTRSNPYTVGGVGYTTDGGMTVTDIAGEWTGNQTYSLWIPITEEIATTEGAELVGWFDYSIVSPFFEGLNGGKFCIFPASEIA